MHYVSVAVSSSRAFSRELQLFHQRGGTLRMSEALRLGLSRKRLYAMRDAGVVHPLSRGIFRLASLEPLGVDAERYRKREAETKKKP